MDNCISFGKYKGKMFSELMREDMAYVNRVLSVSKKSELDILRRLVKEDKKSRRKGIVFGGCLTDRVKKLLTLYDIDEILLNYVVNLKPYEDESLLLEVDVIDSLNTMHCIYPSVFGSFIDYLIRRLVAEIKHIPIEDARAHNITRNNSHIDLLSHLGDSERLFWTTWHADLGRNYKKFVDVDGISTRTILRDIFDVSLSHSMSFYRTGRCEDITRLQNTITENSDMLIEFIDEISTRLKQYSGCIQLNPSFGSVGIPSDCDVIVGNTIIDIKMSKRAEDRYNICQLLGYSALCYEKDGTMINDIRVLNPLRNVTQKWDISRWDGSQRSRFVNFLRNQVEENSLLKPTRCDASIHTAPTKSVEPVWHL